MRFGTADDDDINFRGDRHGDEGSAEVSRWIWTLWRKELLAHMSLARTSPSLSEEGISIRATPYEPRSWDFVGTAIPNQITLPNPSFRINLRSQLQLNPSLRSSSVSRQRQTPVSLPTLHLYQLVSRIANNQSNSFPNLAVP